MQFELHSYYYNYYHYSVVAERTALRLAKKSPHLLFS